MQNSRCLCATSFDVQALGRQIFVFTTPKENKRKVLEFVQKILSNTEEPIVNYHISFNFDSNKESFYYLSPFVFAAVVKSDKVFKNALGIESNFTRDELYHFFRNIGLIQEQYYKQVLSQLFCINAERNEEKIWSIVTGIAGEYTDVGYEYADERGLKVFQQIIVKHCEEEREKLTVLEYCIPLKALVHIVEDYTPLFKTIPVWVEDVFKRCLEKLRSLENYRETKAKEDFPTG